MTLPHETIGYIVDALLATAEWREGKSAEYPDDTRNEEAAELCRKLASEFSEGSMDPDLVARYQRAVDGDRADILAEAENEARRFIGFHLWPNSPDEFLRDILGKVPEMEDAA